MPKMSKWNFQIIVKKNNNKRNLIYITRNTDQCDKCCENCTECVTKLECLTCNEGFIFDQS